MNFEYLNKMVKYIEENLDKKIDLDKLANITNTNLFILERIFMFLTNMTLIEYIKKRRLSKAFEEIRNTKKKIIDIAFKYQYNSAASFNRAFKQLFGITPTECRKGVGSYKIVPMEYFDTDYEKYNFDYEIKRLDEIKLYCYHVSSEDYYDFLYKIRKLYKDVQENGFYKKFDDSGMYGVFFKDKQYNYYLGSKVEYPGFEEFTIRGGEYASFQPVSRKQKDIVNLEKKINCQWVSSTSYDVSDNTKIEYYQGDNCYVYLPINIS